MHASLRLVAALLLVLPGAAQAVEIRAGLHGGFGRLVFEWPAPVTAELTQADGRVVVRFDAPFEGELGPAVQRLGDYLRAAAPGADAHEVVLELAPDIEPRPFTVGERIVGIDLAAAAAPPVEVRTGRHPGYGRVVFEWPATIGYRLERDGELVTLRFARPAPAPLDVAGVPRGLPDHVVEARATTDTVTLRLVPGAEVRHFVVDDRRVVVDVLDADAPPPAPPEPPPAPEPAPPEPTPPGPIPPEPTIALPALPEPPDPAPEIALPDPPPEAPGLVFAWPEPVPATILVRAGRLWAVFLADADEAVMLPEDGPEGMGSPERVDAGAGVTALRFPIEAGLGAEARRIEGAWRVRIDRAALPPLDAPLLRRDDPPGLLIPGAAGVVALDDDAVGDRILLAPLLESGRGTSARRLVDVEFLATVQGVAWRERADGLEATVEPEGVTIGREGGMRLSRASADPVRPAATDPERAEVPTGPPPALRAARALETAGRVLAEAGDHPAALLEARIGPPLDFAGRGLEEGRSFSARRQELLASIEASDPAELPLARLDLARFLFAEGLASDALAVLRAQGEDLALPMARARDALVGAALALMNRDDRAARLLGEPSLDHDADVALWRAVLQARAGNPEAVTAPGVEQALRRLPLRLRARLGAEIALALLEQGDADSVYGVVDALLAQPLRPGERARLMMARGHALARDGAREEAARVWREVARSGHDESRTSAIYALTALDIERGLTTPERAAAIFAAEAPFWREHPHEATMLDGLARLQAEIGDAPAALAAWKRALTRLGDSPAAAAIAGRMQDIFEDGLRDGGAAGPVAALALHDAYPELVPAGDDGRRLLRGLALRLGEAGLVERAGTLLEPLIRHRTAGAERALLGTELAGIRLRAGEVEGALAALAISRSEVPLSPALERRRHLLEAEAQAAIGREETALARLDGLDDREARLLRQDIHWRTGDLDAVTREGRALLAEEPAPLEEAATRAALRLALALAGSEDRAGLVELGRLGEPAPGPHADALRALTDIEPAPPAAIGAERRLAREVEASIESAERLADITRKLLEGPDS